MRDVYQLAKRNMIWLGEFPQDLSRRIEISIDMILAQAREHFTDGSDILSSLTATGAFSISDKPLPPCDWDALAVFFDSSWFTRVWVVQEVALSPLNICLFGDSCRTWFDIEIAAIWLESRRYARREYAGREMVGIANTVLSSQAGNGILDPAAAFSMSQTRNCSVPHDKIYGMLGLIQRNEPESDIVPDYSLPVNDVYTMATRAAIKSDIALMGRIMILNDAQRYMPSPEEAGLSSACWISWLPIHISINHLPPRERCTLSSTGWPSWVPRYDWLDDALRGSYKSPPGVSLRKTGAGNGQPPNMRDLGQNIVLSLQGLIVDRITSIHGKVNRILPSTMKEDFEKYIEWRSLALQSDHTDSDIALTGVMGCRTTYGLNDSAIHAAHRDYVVCGEQIVAGGSTAITREIMTSAISYGKESWERSANRRFCLTGRGMIAMSPPGVRHGDYVCIIFGCYAPFILRRDGEYWTLIGTAYVHGIMDGEYVQQLEKEGKLGGEKRWFDII